MNMFELCYLVQKNPESPAASGAVEGKEWVEQHTLCSNGTVEVTKKTLAQPGQAVEWDVLVAQLTEAGWQPLEGGFYRQEAGNEPADGAVLEKLLGLVMDWSQAGKLDPEVGRIWRDMLINLVTFGIGLPPAPKSHAGDAWAVTDHRRGKLDPRQLERPRGKSVKRHRDPDLQDTRWK